MASQNFLNSKEMTESEQQKSHTTYACIAGTNVIMLPDHLYRNGKYMDPDQVNKMNLLKKLMVFVKAKWMQQPFPRQNTESRVGSQAHWAGAGNRR
ncbi:hypothetical protein ACTXT7_004140 [Hymenolepis weldensis]